MGTEAWGAGPASKGLLVLTTIMAWGMGSENGSPGEEEAEREEEETRREGGRDEGLGMGRWPRHA